MCCVILTAVKTNCENPASEPFESVILETKPHGWHFRNSNRCVFWTFTFTVYL